ncbi:dihydrodipicolinate reductase [Klebsormidium nitens]|uniref:Dihydrodipicolinate reductase n=1 Tax=Klebsormidium nitens TaxID=105231 RepID=A0A1Y1IFL3_KLENI|nr:dihydrodipicolinate reductase [Klebsormidium nitens]|eukprot:GAQ86898.1 dihydrodipicolinate reductase [Klebsormidium nitens]
MGSRTCCPALSREHFLIHGVLRHQHHGQAGCAPCRPARSVLRAGPPWQPAPTVCCTSTVRCLTGGAQGRGEVGQKGPSTVVLHSRDQVRQRGTIVCRAGAGATSRNNIKVVVVGVGSEIGREVVRAVNKARGMEVAGAVDPSCAGQDIGEVAGLEPLELPVLNDIIMVLSSISQARDDLGVVVDIGGGGTAYETVRQATAFGLRSVVGAQDLTPKQLSTLIDFCEKSSMGCVAAPSFSIGEVLLQQAAVNAGFYYGEVDLEERLDPAQQEVPSASVLRTAEALKGLGREFNTAAEDAPLGPDDGLLQRTDAGEGLVIASRSTGGADMRYSQHLRFEGAGESLEVRHTVHSARGYMAGLLLAIRKVARLRSMVYGLEKIL